MSTSVFDRFRGSVRNSGVIEVAQNIGPPLERRPQTPQFFQLIKNRFYQGVDESAHELFALDQVCSIGGDHVLAELPTHQQSGTIFGGEDRAEMVLMLVSEQIDAGADRFPNPAQAVTRPAPMTVKFCLESSPRLIEFRADQGDDVEGAMTVVASGTTLVAAFLYPAKAASPTWSIAARKSSGFFFNQSATTSAEWPGTMSSKSAGRWVRSSPT